MTTENPNTTNTNENNTAATPEKRKYARRIKVTNNSVIFFDGAEKDAEFVGFLADCYNLMISANQSNNEKLSKSSREVWCELEVSMPTPLKLAVLNEYQARVDAAEKDAAEISAALCLELLAQANTLTTVEMGRVVTALAKVNKDSEDARKVISDCIAALAALSSDDDVEELTESLLVKSLDKDNKEK